MSRIGIYGGSFNPPHIGHVQVAKDAIERFVLEKLYIVPAGIPYFKDQSTIAPGEQRLQMCREAFKDIPNVIVTRTEIDRPGNSYTIDTIRELKREGDQVFLVLGTDAYKQLDSWYKADEIRNETSLIVVPRPSPDDMMYTAPEVVLFNLPYYVSSSGIRDLIKRNRPFDHLLPNNVGDMVRSFELYGYRRHE